MTGRRMYLVAMPFGLLRPSIRVDREDNHFHYVLQFSSNTCGPPNFSHIGQTRTLGEIWEGGHLIEISAGQKAGQWLERLVSNSLLGSPVGVL